MRQGWLIAVLLLFLVGCSKSDPEFLDTAGHKIRFSDYRGRWVFLNYWAKWCHPCKEEIPELNQFAREYSKKAVVIGVSFDALPVSTLKKLVTQLQIKYPVLVSNPSQVLKLGSIDVVPTTIVIDPSGRVVKQLYGPQTSHSLAYYLIN